MIFVCKSLLSPLSVPQQCAQLSSPVCSPDIQFLQIVISLSKDAEGISNKQKKCYTRAGAVGEENEVLWNNWYWN